MFSVQTCSQTTTEKKLKADGFSANRKFPMDTASIRTENPTWISFRRQRSISGIYSKNMRQEHASGIAKKLTAMNAPTPSIRKSQLGTNYIKMSPSNSWTFGSVSNILRNQMYTDNYIYVRETSFLYPARKMQQCIEIVMNR